MAKLSNLEKNYIPVRKYNHKEGGELIGEIKSNRNFDFQYIGDATTSYGGKIYYRNSVSPFAKMKATHVGDVYEFTLLVNSKKLSSTELKKFDVLSAKVINRNKRKKSFIFGF